MSNPKAYEQAGEEADCARLRQAMFAKWDPYKKVFLYGMDAVKFREKEHRRAIRRQQSNLEDVT